MLLQNLLRLATFTSLATSSVLPSDVVTYINSVPIISKPLSSVAAPEISETRALLARETVEVGGLDEVETIYCSCGVNLNSYGCSTATNAMVNYLNSNQNVAAKQALGGTVNGVIAFICNTSNLAASINGDTYLTLLQGVVSQTCGSFVAGTYSDLLVYPPSLTVASNLVFGYMNDPGGPDAACDAAKSSTQQYVIPLNDGAG